MPEPFIPHLVLKLTDPKIELQEGKRRARAAATLIYEPGASSIEFPFTAPLGPIEKDDLRWYLESYHLWPVGVFKDRADGVERMLPAWGKHLFQAAFGDEKAAEALTAWQSAKNAERRFSVEVDGGLLEDATEEARAAAREAASELLSLPWEILHDGRGWLFQGEAPVRVRRRLSNRPTQPARPTALPIRILLVSPRPERDAEGSPIGYIDHRISARPLTEAVESLGDLARLTILQPPTYAALQEALQAGDEGQPFDVIHFDGHGGYDHRSGMGGLCFEDVADVGKLTGRAMDFVNAGWLGRLVREHRIPLVFLEACQSAVAEEDPTASVAARLLEEGVASVVAMSHSVLVETSRRFVQAFYGELAGGARVGQAMLAGQQALFADTRRGKVLGAGELRLQDWFVPVLYQEEQDPQLITEIPLQQVRQLEEKKRRLSLGNLPEPPAHSFQGRSRDLLALERLLHRDPWAVVRGIGGQGKTTLAAELARWLVRTARFARAAFVSLDHHRDARAALDTLGHQLVGPHYTIAQYSNLDEALQPIESALAAQPTIVVLDNCESVLPERGNPSDLTDPTDPTAIDTAAELFAVCRSLLEADPRTRLVFTTRESLPAPFDHRGRERELGALDRHDAIELVSEVMKQNGWTPPSEDAGRTPQEITDLVEAVNRHARALVLLAREVASRGVKATTENLRSLMTDLERKHPGDRENSLYASVELSLRRLSPEAREHVRVLAVCQGGVHLAILEILAELEPKTASQLAAELIEVGLGEDLGYGHLRLDPGLPLYLLGELADDEAEALRTRWAEAMAHLTTFLRQQQSKNALLAAQLTLLEVSNLLAMLDRLQDSWAPEDLVNVAGMVERLVAELGRPRDLAHATFVREQAAQKLDEWGHARYFAEDSKIDRLLERGDLPAAYAASRTLLEKCLAAGESAYPGADFDIAMAHYNIGMILKKGFDIEAALELLTEARRCFQSVAAAGSNSAEGMIGNTIKDIGDCLRNLGRLDEAAKAYEESIKCAQSRDDLRDMAVGKFQLGSVRLLQTRHLEALVIYAEAREAFEALGEPRQVAAVWHQSGMVHQAASQFEPAERAYRQALVITVRINDLGRQAVTLNQLGLLYNEMDRLEEAATFYRQTAEVFVRLEELAREGAVRSNLANTLTKLGRYDEARQELQRAIECKKPYGHASEIWKPWSILEEIEYATGDAEAAQAARQQAIETYLAYRHAGGASQSPINQLYAVVARAIQESSAAEVSQDLEQLAARADTPLFLKMVIPRLQFILAGDRAPALADDSELDYDDAVELQLLLESLGQNNPEGI
jgi:tetratricopeptide (TPR) repeat protein